MKKLIVLALLIFCGTFSSVYAQPQQWSANGHWYQAVATCPDVVGVTWIEAKVYAEKYGTHLVTITSEAENQFVFGLVTDPLDYEKYWVMNEPTSGNKIGPWLGGHQDYGAYEPDGSWQWVNNEGYFMNGAGNQSNYTNWFSGEPNNGIDQENALVFFGTGGPTSGWNDFPDIGRTLVGQYYVSKGFIVESDTQFDELPDWCGPVCVSPPNGLIGWWPGDGNANDIVNGNHGTLQYDATFGVGMVGQAFQLDGDGDFIDVPDVPSLNFGTNDFTVGLWVNFNSLAGEQVLIEKWVQKIYVNHRLTRGWSLSKVGSNDIVLSLSNGNVNDIASCSSDFCFNVTPPSIQTGNWYYVAASRNGNVFTLYWNGVPLGDTAGIDHPYYNLDSTSSLKFGHRGNPDDTPGSEDTRQFYLNGLIDEVQIFNRALSDTEIEAIYAAGSAGICKAPEFTCQGFEPPMDKGPVTVKNNRVLPLKSILLNNGVQVTDLDIIAPPVIQVLYNSGAIDAEDVTADALPAGMGTEGNQFEYDGTWWHFNLKTKNYSAPGTYTITMQSGDEAEYAIEPTCTAEFVIE